MGGKIAATVGTFKFVAIGVEKRLVQLGVPEFRPVSLVRTHHPVFGNRAILDLFCVQRVRRCVVRVD